MIHLVLNPSENIDKEQILIRLGYRKKEYFVFEHRVHSYISEDAKLSIYFMSENEIQLVGEVAEDLLKKKRRSGYYRSLESLVYNLKPKKIYNSNRKRIFNELIGKGVPTKPVGIERHVADMGTVVESYEDESNDLPSGFQLEQGSADAL